MQNRFYHFSIAFALAFNLVLNGYAQKKVGGKYITAQGTLKALVVFVEFKNESKDNPYWHPKKPPEFMYQFIDPDTITKSTNYVNLTYFFDRMSFSKLKLIGHPYHTVLSYTEFSAKINGYTRPQIIKDALLQLDTLVNFREYDNWGAYGNYNHYNSADGIVDMIFVIFRSINQIGWRFNGEASLGYGASYEIDSVKIIPKRLAIDGSGVTCIYKCMNPEFLATIARHEFSHFLLGEDHPYSTRENDRHNIWALLSGAKMANAYERERLGWISVPELQADQLNVKMADYVTTGTAYKYHPVNGEPNEYYYFENHQKIHPFDDEGLNKQDKGLYVLHMKDLYKEANNIRCKTANGYFMWDNPFKVPYPPDPEIQLPAFRMISADCSGENHRDALEVISGGREFIRVITDADSVYELGEFYRGFKLEEAFSAEKYNVFSPWSNPNTNTWSGEQTGFALEIIDENDGVLSVSFYLNNPARSSPSIPLNFKTISGQQDSIKNPQLLWTVNSEPDIEGYSIEQKLEEQTWQKIAVVGPDLNSFIDSTLIVGKSGNNALALYRISAFDTQGKYSNFSKTVVVQYSHLTGEIDSLVVSSEQHASQRSFRIASRNYPNPFNSQTTIEFELDIRQHVEVRIFDITGKVVQTLYSGSADKGTHYLHWNGKNRFGQEIASGVYLYQIRSERVVITRRMFMIK